MGGPGSGNRWRWNKMRGLAIERFYFHERGPEWLKIYRESFGPEPGRDMEWAMWFNCMNPVGSAVMYGLFYKDKMIGSYTFSNALVEGKPPQQPCRVGVNAIMLPEFRGRGLFKDFLAEITAIESRKSLLITFPHSSNASSLAAHKKACWREAGEIVFVEIPVQSRNDWERAVHSASMARDFSEMTEHIDWSEPFDLSALVPEFPFLHRSQFWLRWRYSLHPFKKYYYWACAPGYMIGAVYERPARKVFQIVDVRVAAGVEHESLMDRARMIAVGTGCIGIEYPVMAGSRVHGYLGNLGYKTRGECFRVHTVGQFPEIPSLFLGDSDTA